MQESAEARLKRLRMRAWRRGMKEMDLILGRFADTHLDQMDDAALTRFDALLGEYDQDLYRWVTGNTEPPEDIRPDIETLRAFVGSVF